MEEQCSAAANRWLKEHTRWSDAQRRALAAIAPSLLARLPESPPWLLAIGGLPGTGKTTLARLMAHLATRRPALDDHMPASVIVLSIDDYYLPRPARNTLAREVHPLLANRGVPGTHDIDLLFDHIDRLLAGAGADLELPAFDKSTDDRLPVGRQLTGVKAPAGVLLEGWFVGVPPETDTALEHPVTALEHIHDREGRWRRGVNRALQDFDRRLSARHPTRWQLVPPGWKEVLAWRWVQEQDLPRARRRLRGPEDVAEFLGTFERLGRHQLQLDGAGTDLVIRLDRNHHPHLQSRS